MVAERAFLRRLCEVGIAGVAPDSLRLLRQRSWAKPDHKIIFEALVRLSFAPPGSLRGRLPAEATRMGFPEIAWDEFFASTETSSGSRSTSELIEVVFAASKRE